MDVWNAHLLSHKMDMLQNMVFHLASNDTMSFCLDGVGRLVVTNLKWNEIVPDFFRKGVL